MTWTLAQITDLHIVEADALINGRVNGNALLARAVAAINRLQPRPDALLITGDLTDNGRPAEYAALRQLLAPLTMPIYLIPGNHDKRTALREAFSDHDYLPASGELYYLVEHFAPLRVIALDTVLPGASHGHLSSEQLAWLDQRLAEAPSAPTVVMMHHPPFTVGMGMDRIRCQNGDEVAAVLANYHHVERLLCGHCHRFIQRRWANTLATIMPGTAHQVGLDLLQRGEQIVMEPAAIALHRWFDGGGLVSHISYVDDFGGSLPP